MGEGKDPEVTAEIGWQGEEVAPPSPKPGQANHARLHHSGPAFDKDIQPSGGPAYSSGDSYRAEALASRTGWRPDNNSKEQPSHTSTANNSWTNEHLLSQEDNVQDDAYSQAGSEASQATLPEERRQRQELQRQQLQLEREHQEREERARQAGIAEYAEPAIDPPQYHAAAAALPPSASVTVFPATGSYRTAHAKEARGGEDADSRRRRLSQRSKLPSLRDPVTREDASQRMGREGAARLDAPMSVDAPAHPAVGVGRRRRQASASPQLNGRSMASTGGNSGSYPSTSAAAAKRDTSLGAKGKGPPGYPGYPQAQTASTSRSPRSPPVPQSPALNSQLVFSEEMSSGDAYRPRERGLPPDVEADYAGAGRQHAQRNSLKSLRGGQAASAAAHLDRARAPKDSSRDRESLRALVRADFRRYQSSLPDGSGGGGGTGSRTRAPQSAASAAVAADTGHALDHRSQMPASPRNSRNGRDFVTMHRSPP